MTKEIFEFLEENNIDPIYKGIVNMVSGEYLVYKIKIGNRRFKLYWKSIEIDDRESCILDEYKSNTQSPGVYLYETDINVLIGKIKEIIEEENNMIRPYTTSEMIQELTIDKTRKFKRLHDGLEMSAPKGQLVWESGNDFLSITDDEWVGVDQSVHYVTAFSSGKAVRIEDEYLVKMLWNTCDSVHFLSLGRLKRGGYTNIFDMLKLIHKYLSKDDISNAMTTAKWYIKEEY